jgi:O-antigen/teichoic acid export membrane protein
LIIFSDAIVKYWLGPEFTDAIPIMRIIFVSIVFSLFNGAVGNVLEASKVKPINLINLCISLGLFLSMSGILLFLVKIFSPIISLSIGFTSGIVCVGILSYISIRKIYSEKLNKDLNYLWTAVWINVLLGGLSLLIKSLVISKFYHLVIFEIMIGVIYLSILWLLKTDWLRKIPEKVLLK